MITANVIHRVFRIKAGNARGSAFAIDVDQRQYLVTAKHVVATLPDRGNLEVFSNRNWASMSVRVVGHAAGDIDVSVLAIDRPLTPTDLPLEPAMKGMIYGQDAFFLGFPFNDLSRYAFGPNGYPLPFVKKAILSCFDGGLMYLDGHNNPGFSGGPVVYVPAGERDFRVAGVVSSYRAEVKPVMSGTMKTGLVHHENTGIVVAHSVDHAVDIVRANPIGCAV